MPSENNIKCEVCGEVVNDYLGDHLLEVHGMTGQEYLTRHPGAQTLSPRILDRMKAGWTPRREMPQMANLTVNIGFLPFPLNLDVPASACLPMPEAYRFPEFGELKNDIDHAAVAMLRKRHGFIHGAPGTGKDAFLHAVSHLARIPALIRSIKPGTNIGHWFYARSFDKEGTTWERGPLLDALVNGYEVRDEAGNLIRRVPYLIVITDFDRADRAQAEHLRLIMDSTLGRVEGPQGTTETVLPGTMIWATGNAPGGGDPRGRCISSNVIDASIMDRFERTFQFHAMAWKDEEKICRDKFPALNAIAPFVFEQVGQCTNALRKAIENETLFAEFSHRGVCSILGHTEDLILVNGKGKTPPNNILVGGARAWLDRLGDPVTRQAAVKAIDAFIPGGVLNAAGGPPAADCKFE